MVDTYSISSAYICDGEEIIVIKLFIRTPCITDQPYDATRATAQYCLGIIADSILFRTRTNLMMAEGRGNCGQTLVQ